MRFLPLAFLILLIFMAKFTCPALGCKRKFKSGAALSTHKRYCRDKIATTARLLLSRRQEQSQANLVDDSNGTGESNAMDDSNVELDQSASGPQVRLIAELFIALILKD
jgi:hypothetical protein